MIDGQVIEANHTQQLKIYLKSDSHLPKNVAYVASMKALKK